MPINRKEYAREYAKKYYLKHKEEIKQKSLEHYHTMSKRKATSTAKKIEKLNDEVKFHQDEIEKIKEQIKELQQHHLNKQVDKQYQTQGYYITNL